MKRIIVLLVIIAVAMQAIPVSASRPGYQSLSLTDGELRGVADDVKKYADGENFLVKLCFTSMELNCISHGKAARTASERDVPDDSEYYILARLAYGHGIDPTCGATLCFKRGDEEISRRTPTIIIEDFVFAKP